MTDNDIKRALESIEPAEGAEARMYEGIMRKAAAQGTGQKRVTSIVGRYAALAACCAVIIALALVLPRLNGSGTTDTPGSGEYAEPPVMAGSPVEDVSGPEAFAALDIDIDAPENASDAEYFIITGDTARVSFTLDGHGYTYSAARLEEDFSGLAGDTAETIELDNAVIQRVEPELWRAHWELDGISFYLINTDGASLEQMSDLTRSLMQK